MNLKAVAIVLVVVLVVLVVVIGEAQAQSRRNPYEDDLAYQVDRTFSTASKLHNRQKFFSILIFVALGGAVVVAQLRGIQKVASGN